MGGGIAFSMDEDSGISTQTLSTIDSSTKCGGVVGSLVDSAVNVHIAV